jgi:hypothetical protein
MAPYVEFATGLSEFALPHKPKKTTTEEITDPVFNYIIPQTVRRIYNIPIGTTITNAENSQSVIEFVPYGAPYLYRVKYS